MEEVVLKTVAGLMNAEGGSLLLGVVDDRSVAGLKADYMTPTKPTRDRH